MADMTATGWVPTNIEVVRSAAPWGAQGGRENVVKLTFQVDAFGANSNYPTNGIPLPGPSAVGLGRIDYVIPISPFFNGLSPVTTFSRTAVPWGVYHPSAQASGVTSTIGGFSARFSGLVPTPSGTGATDFAGTAPSIGLRVHFREAITQVVVSTYQVSSAAEAMVAYAVFGEF